MKLVTGVYETLVSQAIQQRLAEFPENQYYIGRADIDSAESCQMLARHLAEAVCDVLKNHFQSSNSAQSISDQIEVVNRVLKFIESEWNDSKEITTDYLLCDRNRLQFLQGIYSKVGRTTQQVQQRAQIHPVSGYRVSSLFTGGHDLSIDDELRRDIQTADRIDLVISFIKFEGLRLLYAQLNEFLQRPGTKLRVLTTTYMGATDPKAIRWLHNLRQYGDVEIKASFNTRQERLHAKSYVFYRNTGYHTAYIGSSNLSRTALTKGLEWNLRVTSVENAHIIAKVGATFDNYWNSDDFIPLDSEQNLDEFENAILAQRNTTRKNINTQYLVHFERKVHQIKVLEKLQYERNNLHSYRNLIIAATGTGKTAISAFDFKDFNKRMVATKHRRARLLFIAHRERILSQALATFRSVMGDANFGEIWTGRTAPGSRSNLDHLFITVQTLNNHWEAFDSFGSGYYDYVVIDEVHHSQAGSYRQVFSKLTPEIFIGLTATPERMDGREIKPDFNNRFAAEIRLQEAIDQRLLSPFDYFCITDDSVNLSEIPCRGDAYDKGALATLYKSVRLQRFQLIQNALENYLTDPSDCKAVCFCAGINHAEEMAQMLNQAGYKAQAVTSRNSDRLDQAAQWLTDGTINYLCVADILNEGVDIPEIDTILLLRPTESLTVFLQQLGRGLRLADDKTCLTVLDFVAQANKNYNYERRFRALAGNSRRSVSEEVKDGFKFLPRGCTITMERQAQQYILQNITAAIFNRRRLLAEAANFTQNTGRELTLSNFLDNFGLDLRTIYKTPGSWSRLKVLAGKDVPSFDANAKYTRLLEGGLARLYHTNSKEYLTWLRSVVDNDFIPDVSTPRKKKFACLFYHTLWLDPIDKVNRNYSTQFSTPEQAITSLRQQPWIKEELSTLISLRLEQLSTQTQWLEVAPGSEIELYGCYSADEIHLMLEGQPGRWQVSGCQYNHAKKFAMVFVTLNKSDHEYSPTTLYEDYAISPRQFHWQTMNRTSPESAEGQRIINHRRNGYRYLLFVRDTKTDEYGNTNAYYCLGDMNFRSSHGSCPMNVVWDMQAPIPAFILEGAKAI